MQPPSFDEFIKQQNGPGVDDTPEELAFCECPTPGCGSKVLSPQYEDRLLTGFSCDRGCVFSVKRNAFTGDITYFLLVKFDESRFMDPGSIRGMKFTPLGECYADWY